MLYIAFNWSSSYTFQTIFICILFLFSTQDHFYAVLNSTCEGVCLVVCLLLYYGGMNSLKVNGSYKGGF